MHTDVLETDFQLTRALIKKYSKTASNKIIGSLKIRRKIGEQQANDDQ